VAIGGESGCGKSTLLRLMAGLDSPNQGTIALDGGVPRPGSPLVRMMFQDARLLPWKRVLDNVSLGLPPQRRAEARDALEEVGLAERGGDWPSILSGGQRQRVALARALAVEPKVLLLDEPFGALDAKVRQELRRWLRRLHAEIHLTSVFVTHDQEEALELANRVVVMNEGEIEQDGTPEQVVEHPATPFVVNFLGNVNIFHGRVQDGKALLGPLALDYPEHPHDEPKTAAGYARPHDLEIGRTEDGGGLWATVTDVRAVGALVKIEVNDADGKPIQVELGREQYDLVRAIIGERIYVRPRRVRVFINDE
jgi:sulfate transport system ATP-binding protein